jgi:NAD(P)-dependent dehydrogenase (short-subunit alcohol dehydrogenase family)
VILGLLVICAVGVVAWLIEVPPLPRVAVGWTLGPDMAAPRGELATAVGYSTPCTRVAAPQQAEARFGAIDFLVSNAGIDFLGAIEEQDEADYRKIFEVNFFGAVALLRLALPAMRARDRGMIVNMSSMDGIASLPANGFYSASKFALEGMTEAGTHT